MRPLQSFCTPYYPFSEENPFALFSSALDLGGRINAQITKVCLSGSYIYAIRHFMTGSLLIFANKEKNPTTTKTPNKNQNPKQKTIPNEISFVSGLQN